MMATAQALRSLPLRQRPSPQVLAMLAAPPPRVDSISIFDSFRGRQRIMANQQDLSALRDLLRWARAHEGDPALRARSMADGLERALAIIQNERSDATTEILLIGCLQAHERHGPNNWICVDRTLRNDMLQLILDRIGPVDPGERRKPK